MNNKLILISSCILMSLQNISAGVDLSIPNLCRTSNCQVNEQNSMQLLWSFPGFSIYVAQYDSNRILINRPTLKGEKTDSNYSKIPLVDSLFDPDYGHYSKWIDYTGIVNYRKKDILLDSILASTPSIGVVSIDDIDYELYILFKEGKSSLRMIPSKVICNNSITFINLLAYLTGDSFGDWEGLFVDRLKNLCRND